MCCIFTCCGWMIDLIQRVWVFLMSCCICTAVCCVLLVTSMSGVALGYNYSLAEYIDLKETNVSVFIKRGVFDDDVVNDLVDFRRKGANARNLRANNLKTAVEEVGPDEMPPSSGRRLDDTIVQSNDNTNFEGSLMKLTLKPPYVSTAMTNYPDDSAMIPAMSSYQPDSLDQLKAIQGIINARKAAAARNPLDKYVGNNGEKSTYAYGNVNAYMQGTPPTASGPDQYRKMMLSNPGYQRSGPGAVQYLPSEDMLMPKNINPARFAVPSDLSRGNWEVPKMDEESYNKQFELGAVPSMPKPVTYRTGPIRPSTTKRSTEYEPQETFAPHKATQAEPTPATGVEQNVLDDNEERFDERSGSDDVRNKYMLEKLPGPKIVGQENNEYYDEELKGLPVRRRRSINYGKAKLKLRAKVAKAIPQKVNSGHFSKHKVGKSISNEITGPSIIMKKLRFHNNALCNETTSTNKKEVRIVKK